MLVVGKILSLTVMLLAAVVALPQCAAGPLAWDMALPIQIVATSEVPEVERWHAALRLGINELGGTATTRRAQQQIWLTSATYGWCDPIFDGSYVMYTMEVDGAGTSAIFMCWNVIANGSWSDITIARFMRSGTCLHDGSLTCHVQRWQRCHRCRALLRIIS